jgi:uncharacterized alkaline shock family protein YloU
MAAVNVKDGLVKLLKKEHITHGIQVVIAVNNEITIDFHVIIAYGVGITTVCDNLIETVRYKVEQFTGMKGKYVPIRETIRGFKEIIEGLHDDLPESAFLFVGTIDEAVEKARSEKGDE